MTPLAPAGPVAPGPHVNRTRFAAYAEPCSRSGQNVCPSVCLSHANVVSYKSDTNENDEIFTVGSVKDSAFRNSKKSNKFSSTSP